MECYEKNYGPPGNIIQGEGKVWFVVVVQLLSCVWLFVTSWTAAYEVSLSFIIFQNLLKFMSIQSVIPSNHLILCCPLFFLPSIFPSIRVFSNELVLGIRWQKYWSFSFSTSISNEYSGLIPFRMDWLDLLAVQGTLKSLLKHCSSKASVLWCSGFWSHQYMAKLMGKQWKQWQTLFLGAPKSLQMVIAAMKLKDAYSLEGNSDRPR